MAPDAALEVGVDISWTYDRSRGAFVGIEAVAQVFVERKKENELQYSYILVWGRMKVTKTVLPCVSAGRGSVLPTSFVPTRALSGGSRSYVALPATGRSQSAVRRNIPHESAD